MTFPAPLTPQGCDLRDFKFMPLECERLRRSKQWLIAKRRPEIGFYAINLWMAAWHERPAGSLEDDDDVLANAAMCDPALWPAVREDALRGWIKCSDGRLYHEVVAAKALEAFTGKLVQRKSSEAGNAKRYGRQFDPAPHDAAIAATLQMLAAIDPHSPVISKHRAIFCAAELPSASDMAPGGSGSGSQGIGTGIGTEREIEKDSSLDSPEDRSATSDVSDEEAEFLRTMKAAAAAADIAPQPEKPPTPSKAKGPRGRATLPEDWAPRETDRTLAFGELKMTEGEYADALDSFRDWTTRTGVKSRAAVPNWNTTFRNHLRDFARKTGAIFRKVAPTPVASAAPPQPRQRPPIYRTEEGDRFARTMTELVGATAVGMFLRDCEFVSAKPLRIRAPDDITHHKLTAGTHKNADLRALFTALAAQGVEVLPPLASERAM